MATLPRPVVRRLSRRRVNAFRIGSWIVIGLAAVAVEYPFLRVVAGLFIHDGRLDFSPIVQAITYPDLPHLLTNTVLIVVISGVPSLVVGSVLAWLNERTDARIPFVTDVVPLVPFLLPSISLAIGWVLLLSSRAGLLNVFLRWVLHGVGIHITSGPLDIFNVYGLAFCYFVTFVPYVFLFVSAGLRNMPSELEEQARVCGAGPLKTLRVVTLRALAPSLAASLLIVVWFGLAMFSIPRIIGTGANFEVLTVRIINLINFSYPPRTDVAVGLSMFVLLFVGGAWALQLRVMRKGNFVTIGGRGTRSARISLGKWRWPSRLLVLGYLLVAGVLPIIGLLLTALNGYWTAHIKWSQLGFTAFNRLFSDPANVVAVRNSLLLALIAGTCAVLFSALLSVHVKRTGTRLSRVFESSIRIPVVISSFVLVVGMIIAFSGAPFELQGTFLLFFIAYVVTCVPQSSIVSDTAVAQVGNDMVEAATVAGAVDGKVFRRIQLPLMMPGLVAGWIVVFVVIAGDMNIAALLGSSGTPVVGYQILSIYDTGTYADLAALALSLTVLSTVCVAIGSAVGRYFGGRRRFSSKPVTLSVGEVR